MKTTIIPLFLLLFSCSTNTPHSPDTPNIKSEWISEAFETLEKSEYSNIKAVSWWHEDFDSSYLRIDSSKQSLEAYRRGVGSSFFASAAQFYKGKLVAPDTGMYHSAYPDFGGTEDLVTLERIETFENLAGRKNTWAYFSNNWYNAIEFPSNAVETIHSAGMIPFIRMMPRSGFDKGGPDPRYTMQRIIDGDYNLELIRWAIKASQIPYPLLVEFGTEVNGNWFPWNGQYNGGGPTDGPERFRDAYRHIINLCNENGANNITWFFHIDAYSQPNKEWNRMENYYPGDEYIDWLGVSIYGPQEQRDDFQSFSDILKDIYPALSGLADKPI
ncbi:MAG: hypothetical protein KAH21_12865, partial [Spirochaetaceae bacterium]|nr:hypothetical protein [Spirochaetaceae bacterium]